MTTLAIPDEQQARQAVASLGGYVYQAVRATDAWLRLPADGVLLLEVAEDFAVLARDTLEMNQVKAVAGETLTLRTAGARKAIAALLQFESANPNLAVRLNYLTIAGSGHEAGAALPGGAKGVDYWRAVARGADPAPLRTLLLATQTDAIVLEFVRNVDDERLRQLAAGIHWVTHDQPAALAEAALQARLEVLATERHGHVDDGRRALPFLVWRMLETSIAEKRELTRQDFEDEWSAATTTTISFGVMRQMTAMLAGGASGVALPPLAPAALPARLAPREALVDELRAVLAATGVLWLHGSSGLGKSLLARLISRASNREWHVVKLRDCPDDGTRLARLSAAAAAIRAEDFGGIILDDLATTSSESVRDWIAAIARQIADSRDGAIIVTADREPPPSIRVAFEPLTIAARSAPYLEHADVAAIVDLAGGDPKHWAGVIHLTCGAGHPVLVDARVAGLASRNWPEIEMTAGFDARGSPQEVVEVRKEIALRLLQGLADDAHLLLLRLTALAGPFDRLMMEAAAAVAPPISRSGALVDFLVGPWIEEGAGDRFTPSPLVAMAGVTGLSDDEITRVRQAVLTNLVERKQISAELFSSMIILAMVLRDATAFLKIANGIIGSGNRPALAQHCMPLLFLKPPDGVRLVPEHPFVSMKLRTAQLIVAANLPQSSSLERIDAEAVAENATLPKPARAMTRYTQLIALLTSEKLEASPAFWLPHLVEYRALVDSKTVPEELADTMDSADLGGITLDQFAFVVRTREIDDVTGLAALFDALEAIDPVWRLDLLGASTRLLGGAPLFVQTAWSTAAMNGTLDAAAAAGTYAQLTEAAQRWGAEDVAIECIRSCAVMHDEYLGRGARALEILDEADARYPGNERLARSRATVLATLGRHDEERAVLARIAETYSVDEPLERFMMIRIAAISAGKIGKFDEAGRLFREAADLVGPGTTTLHPAMGTALLADAAAMDLADGQNERALNALRDALLALEDLGDDATEAQLYVREATTQVIQWGVARTEQIDIPIDLAKSPGRASELKPKLGEETLPDRPRTFPWYALVHLELRLGIDVGASAILRRLEDKLGTAVGLAATVRSSELQICLDRRDVDRFLAILPEYAMLCEAMGEQREQPAKIRNRLQPLAFGDLASLSPVALGFARTWLTAMMGALALAGEEPRAIQLTSTIGGAGDGLRAAMESPPGQPIAGADVEMTGLLAIRWLQADSVPTPDQLYAATMWIFVWLAQLAMIAPIGPVWALLVDQWLQLIRLRRITLVSPALVVPKIELALELAPSTEAVAHLLHEAELGVSTRLPPDYRMLVHRVLGR
ncbi:hypothetical protein [Sphingomonas azotifigens]|uniref:hypothetical protein n=1 Tax=Sphingomonas azotifigens TaxID=330920 RepID=UPI000A072C38|nr:hypothetical protein [Sphingomonas azotifigens]